MNHSGDTGKIAVEFRIGVTGHRSLADEVAVASDVRAAVQRILELRSTRGTETTPVGLTVVSALAEGADRILVQEVNNLQPARLEAVLPMQARDYCQDFDTAASRAVFNALLAKADQTLVVGDAEHREEGYERAGRTVVERSDVMIAVWDGEEGRGRGGTADIVAYARQRRVPLVLVLPDGKHRMREEWKEHDGAAKTGLGPLSPSAFAQLDRYNRRRFSRPPAGSAMNLVPPSLEPDANQRLAPFVAFALPYFTRADEIAKQFQRLALFSTRSLYALAAAAVIIVSAQLLFHGDAGIAWAEVAALLLISGVLILGRTMHWHEQWISTRYLAERIRSSVFLAAAGVGEELEAARSSSVIADPTDEWVNRAFKEVWLRRPVQRLTEADVGPVQRLLADAWIMEQLVYHQGVEARSDLRHRQLRSIAVGFFLLSVAAAVLHSVGALGSSRWSELVAFGSVIIPAVAAAVSGYSAHREFGQHATRSRHMVARLRSAKTDMEAAETLAAVRGIAINAEQLMRGEAADWYALVHLHEFDVPA